MDRFDELTKKLVFNEDGTMKSCFMFGSTKEYTKEMQDSISDAMRQVARETYEDAALIVDKYAEDCSDWCLGKASDAIRKRKDELDGK